MKKINLLTFLAVVALAALVAACASPASSESDSPVATPASGVTAEATSSGGAGSGGSPTPEVTSEATAQATAEATTGAEASPSPSAETGTAEATQPAATPTFEPGVQGWPLLLDPEYAFSVRYPQGWLIGEEDVAEEDAPLVRLYGVAPADWEDENAPASIEVLEGAADDIEGVYPGYADAEAQEFAAAAARIVELTDGDDAGSTLYVFQNPEREDWWVVIRVRSAEDADVEDLGRKLANSLRWGELPEEPEETPESSS